MKKGFKKQFCPRGHDTFIIGRYANKKCVICEQEYRKLPQVIEYQQNFRIEHKDENTEYQRNWYMEHKNEIKAHLNEIKNTVQFKRMKRNSDLLWRRGISINAVDKMLDDQNGKCAICLKSTDELKSYNNGQKFGVDHNHITNQIRGLLCVNCNLALGNFKDSIQNLQNAIKYLTKYKENSI